MFRRGETPLIAGRCCSCSVFVAGSRIRPTCVCMMRAVGVLLREVSVFVAGSRRRPTCACLMRAVGVFDAGS